MRGRVRGREMNPDRSATSSPLLTLVQGRELVWLFSFKHFFHPLLMVKAQHEENWHIFRNKHFLYIQILFEKMKIDMHLLCEIQHKRVMVRNKQKKNRNLCLGALSQLFFVFLLYLAFEERGSGSFCHFFHYLLKNVSLWDGNI